MGWTGQYRPPGMTDREFVEQHVLATDRYTIEASATVNNVFYAAVWSRTTGDVFGFVMPMIRGREEFCWKGMTEEEGPCEDLCPARILDKLSATDAEYAREWRARCRENARRRANAPKPGAIIEFRQPLTFRDGRQRQRFTLESRSTFRADDGMRVRIPSWRTRTDWEVAS